MHGDSRIYLASVMAFLIAKKTEAPRNREASPGPWIEESNQIQFLTPAKLQPCWPPPPPPPAPFEDTSHCCDISKNSPFTCHSSLPRSCLVTQRSFPTESCVTRQKWLRGILQYMQEWIMKQKGNQDFGRNLCISLELFLEAIIKTGFLSLRRPQIFIDCLKRQKKSTCNCLKANNVEYCKWLLLNSLLTTLIKISQTSPGAS